MARSAQRGPVIGHDCDVGAWRQRRAAPLQPTFGQALLSAPAVADADRSLPVPGRSGRLARRTAVGPGRGPAGWPPRRGPVQSLAGASKTACRTESAVPDGAADLVADLYSADARGADLTDILLRGSPRPSRTCEPGSPAASACARMAEATTTHGFWELMRIARGGGLQGCPPRGVRPRRWRCGCRARRARRSRRRGSTRGVATCLAVGPPV